MKTITLTKSQLLLEAHHMMGLDVDNGGNYTSDDSTTIGEALGVARNYGHGIEILIESNDDNLLEIEVADDFNERIVF